MRILGIHDGHNASVCLLEDGKIKLAIQEERLTNFKNKGGFPKESIKFLLKYLHLSPKNINFVAFASKHSSIISEDNEKRFEKSKTIIRRSLEKTFIRTPFYTLYKKRRKKQRLESIKKSGFSLKNVFFIDHHLCHAATAYYGSNFKKNEPVLVLTNDGIGDGLCSTVYIAKDARLKKIAETSHIHSLALIYAQVTKLLGFVPLEHEYKLMGMAPYASEKGTQIGYSIFRDLISIPKSNPITFQKNTIEETSLLVPRLMKRSRFVRFDWLCAGLQKFTEDLLVQWVKNCISKTKLHTLALAGGIFMNVKANKKIMELPEVKDLFIFPSCSDETISIGAAYWVYNKYKGKDLPDIEPISHFYLGDEFNDHDVLTQINLFSKQFKFEYQKYSDIEKEIAKLLAKQQVVARCKGRMEFGARALGNRSILADPTDLTLLREINMMVKKRDFWMPFAPVILKEREKEYIINPKNISSPYMILSFDSTEKRDEYIAAVHQADFTARPQVLAKQTNPNYYRILKEFEKLTGRGVLLNTSFNLHGFPIVHGPKEAIEVFRDSGLKYLAVGNYMLKKA